MKASELKKGMIIKEGGEFFEVVEMDHKTPGNLRAIYQATLRSLLNPKIVNRRYSPSDSVEKVDLESKKAQYLFRDHSGFHFMDMQTYETFDALVDKDMYEKLNENDELIFIDYNGNYQILEKKGQA